MGLLVDGVLASSSPGARGQPQPQVPGGHLCLLPDRIEIVAPTIPAGTFNARDPVASGPTSNSPGLTDELRVADQSNR